MDRKQLLKELKTTDEKLTQMLDTSGWANDIDYTDQHLATLRQVMELRKTVPNMKKCWEQVNQTQTPHPVDMIHQIAANDVEKVGNVIKNMSEQSQIQAIQAYQYFFAQEMGAVLEDGAIAHMADVEEDSSLGESWLDIAKSRPLLTPSNQKSLPSSDNKS